MKIRFHCPSGHPLSVSDDLVGKRVRCARCKQVARVPDCSSREPTGQKWAESDAAQQPPQPLPEPLPKPAVLASTQAKPARRPLPKPKPALKPELKPGPKPGPQAKRKPKSSRWANPVPEAPPVQVPAATEPPSRESNADRPTPPESESTNSKSRWMQHKSRRDRRRAKGGTETSPLTAGSKDSEPSPPDPLQPDPPQADPPQADPPQRRMAIPKRAARGPTLMPADVYRPDEGKRVTVRWLALILALIVLFSIGPVFVRMHWNLQTAPGWARIVVLMAVLQSVYIAWMLNHPDWASVWIVMLVFAIVASIYGTATAMVLVTPLEKPMLLGMGEVRHTATAWCGAVLSAMSLATYLCGRTSAKWRRTFELERAGRQSKGR